MNDVRMQPATGPFKATIKPPGSKSLTNRALVISALAAGRCELSNVLFADDTAVMLNGLQKLGFQLQIDPVRKHVAVHGTDGKIPATNAEIFCGNSGTTIRFLTALCSLGSGEFLLDGVARMRQRPIGELVNILKNLGVRLGYAGQEGFPPVKIHARGLPGGMMRYGAAQSSQFLSAVLMVCPHAVHELQVDLEPNQTSWPYVAMTMRLMHEFGVTAELMRDQATDQPRRIIVPREKYQATKYAIEPDASNAGYFLAAAAIHPGANVTIEGLGKASLQGDVGFADILHQMGADLVFGKDFITITGADELHGIETDLGSMPDTAQTLAVIALFAKGPTTIRGLKTLRVKETDRLEAVGVELRKLGAAVEIQGDEAIVINPPETPKPAEIDTYDDHRMAMSFALAGTKIPGIVIRDPQCTAKTYPEYFEDLDRVIRG